MLAYIDPGNGSVILQAIIGGLAGVIYVLRKTIRNFFHVLKRGFKKRDPKTERHEDK